VPIVYKSSKLSGILQIVGTSPNDGFTDDDLSLLKIIAQALSSHLNGLKQSWYDKFEVKTALDKTFQSTQIDGNYDIMKFSNKMFQEKKNPLKGLCAFLSKMEHFLESKFDCNQAQILLVDKQDSSFLSF
jgi:hypothetical protein